MWIISENSEFVINVSEIKNIELVHNKYISKYIIYLTFKDKSEIEFDTFEDEIKAKKRMQDLFALLNGFPNTNSWRIDYQAERRKSMRIEIIVCCIITSCLFSTVTAIVTNLTIGRTYQRKIKDDWLEMMEKVFKEWLWKL